eukprot:gene14793-31432_t
MIRAIAAIASIASTLAFAPVSNVARGASSLKMGFEKEIGAQ